MIVVCNYRTWLGHTNGLLEACVLIGTLHWGISSATSGVFLDASCVSTTVEMTLFARTSAEPRRRSIDKRHVLFDLRAEPVVACAYLQQVRCEIRAIAGAGDRGS